MESKPDLTPYTRARSPEGELIVSLVDLVKLFSRCWSDARK